LQFNQRVILLLLAFDEKYFDNIPNFLIKSIFAITTLKTELKNINI